MLLDTQVLMWALEDRTQLSAQARAVLTDPGNECWVSSSSVWEIAINTLLGRHQLGRPLAMLEEAVERAGLRTLGVTIKHAAAVEHIRTPRADAFDRLLLAQCEVETLRLLTADRVLAKLPVAIAG